MKEKFENEDLKDIAKHIEEEARMILPGIQALFGFQLIAVFSNRFDTALDQTGQSLHVLALICTALSAVLTIAPAAFHRQAEPRYISEHFIKIAGQFLCISLILLSLGTCLDFYLICEIIFKNYFLSIVLSIILFIIMIYFWFLFPKFSKPMNQIKDRFH